MGRQICTAGKQNNFIRFDVCVICNVTVLSRIAL